MVLKRFGTIIFLILTVILIGTVGYQIIEGYSLIEAFYMTIITITTVGFHEVRPLSISGMIFTIVLILSGVAIITTSVSVIFTTVIEGTFGALLRRQRMEQNLSKITGHFIICGLGAVGEDVITEFLRSNESFVLIEKNQDIINKVLKENPKVLYVQGDATEDETLRSAGIERARGIIAVLGNDSDNMYICLSARSLNPKLRIIARVIESESIAKLKRAGADYVFSPEKIGGIRLAAAALRPTVTSFLDSILTGEYLNLILDEVIVQGNSSLVGKSLREAAITKNIGIIIPAIKSIDKETITFNPSSDQVIKSHDALVVFGTHDQIKELRKICTG